MRPTGGEPRSKAVPHDRHDQRTGREQSQKRARQQPPETMPRIVRHVLLISVAASIAMLGLLGIVHLLENAGMPRRPAETDRRPASLPPGSRPASG